MPISVQQAKSIVDAVRAKVQTLTEVSLGDAAWRTLQQNLEAKGYTEFTRENIVAFFKGYAGLSIPYMGGLKGQEVLDYLGLDKKGGEKDLTKHLASLLQVGENKDDDKHSGQDAVAAASGQQYVPFSTQSISPSGTPISSRRSSHNSSPVSTESPVSPTASPATSSSTASLSPPASPSTSVVPAVSHNVMSLEQAKYIIRAILSQAGRANPKDEELSRENNPELKKLKEALVKHPYSYQGITAAISEIKGADKVSNYLSIDALKDASLKDASNESLDLHFFALRTAAATHRELRAQLSKELKLVPEKLGLKIVFEILERNRKTITFAPYGESGKKQYHHIKNQFKEYEKLINAVLYDAKNGVLSKDRLAATDDMIFEMKKGLKRLRKTIEFELQNQAAHPEEEKLNGQLNRIEGVRGKAGLLTKIEQIEGIMKGMLSSSHQANSRLVYGYPLEQDKSDVVDAVDQQRSPFDKATKMAEEYVGMTKQPSANASASLTQVQVAAVGLKDRKELGPNKQIDITKVEEPITLPVQIEAKDSTESLCKTVRTATVPVVKDKLSTELYLYVEEKAFDTVKPITTRFGKGEEGSWRPGFLSPGKTEIPGWPVLLWAMANVDNLIRISGDKKTPVTINKGKMDDKMVVALHLAAHYRGLTCNSSVASLRPTSQQHQLFATKCGESGSQELGAQQQAKLAKQVVKPN